MSFSVPKGWERDSDKLYIHNSGVRIQLMTYRQKEGWYLVPVDLDQPVVEFEPTPEGRDKAFEAFAKGAVSTKAVKKKATAPAKPKKGKPIAVPKEDEAAEGEEPAAAAEGEADEEEEEEEEEEDEATP